MKNIAIIDLEVGNLLSLEKIISQKANVVITKDKDEILKCDAIVLPGVGSFGYFMNRIDEEDLRQLFLEQADKKPFLGVCLGMQVMFQASEEDNYKSQGLGLFKGKCKKLDDFNKQIKVPHMGWNEIEIKKNSQIFTQNLNKSDFYFVHSYHVEPEDDTIISSTTMHGKEVVSSVEDKKRKIYGFQFHPEKSCNQGIELIKKFLYLS